MRKIIGFLVVVLLFSCKKEQNEIEVPTLIAKWNVENNSEYISFEFTEAGNYIIEKVASDKNYEYIVGLFQLIDENSINLSDFGIINIADLSLNSIDLFFVDSLGSQVNITASMQAQIESSTQTDLLTNTWSVLSYNGNIVSGTQNDMNVIFSQSGTYFSWNENPEYNDAGGMAEWMWANNDQTYFRYRWGPIWYSNMMCEIVELSANSLIVFDIPNDDTWVLEPYSGKSLKEGTYNFETNLYQSFFNIK